MKNLIRVLPVMLICALATFAQTNRGGITGTVVDATGAVVPGATVTITNLGTNQTVKLTTSASGLFTATSLEPVEYSIAVEAGGFKKTFVKSVKVDTASIATTYITLETGVSQSRYQ